MKRILALMLLVLNVALANNELALKTALATKTDLIGTWMMIGQQLPKAVDTQSLFFAPHQIFVFDQNNGVRNFSSNEEFKPDYIDLLITSVPVTSSFQIESGLLTIEKQGNKNIYAVVSLVTEDFTNELYPSGPKLKKGMLIMSYLRPDKKAYLRRYLTQLRNDE